MLSSTSLPNPAVNTTIHESFNIRDLLKYCTYNSFVILDLDNTVMESAQELGSDQWFVNLMEYACKIIPNKKEACDAVITIYHAVQHHTAMMAVEADVVKVIKTLQDIDILVIALTARSKEIISPTIHQLKKLGIHLDNQWGKIYLDIPLDAKRDKAESKNDKAIFSGGVIFCNGYDKGACFQSFVKELDYFPKNVIMIDDKEKHLQSVKKVVESWRGNFRGLRYGYLDKKILEIDMLKADQQLMLMHKKFSEPTIKAIKKIKQPKQHSLFSNSLLTNIENKKETTTHLKSSYKQS